MLPEVIFAVVIGCVFGVFTGLLPGIHINLVSAVVLSSSFFLLKHFSAFSLAAFIISMSTVHSFLDIIPSVFLGAPESATALGVLPGHRYMLRGNGMMAVKLNLLGSFFGMLLSVFLFPLFVLLVHISYGLIKRYIAFFLSFIIFLMLLTDNKKAWAFVVLALSASLGFIVFGISSRLMFPMFSGLFGIPTLIMSLKPGKTIPKQKMMEKTQISKRLLAKAVLSGQFSGFLTAMLPGVGSGTAAIISSQITRKLGDRGFMVLLGTINTANFILSIAAYYVILKARNGSIIAVSSLIPLFDAKIVVFFLSVALLSGSVAVFLALAISRIAVKAINRINYNSIALATIVFISSLVIFITGFKGFAVMATATAIGLIPAIAKTRRIHAMGCVIVPVLRYFIS